MLLEDRGPVLAPGDSRGWLCRCGCSGLERGKAQQAEPKKLASGFLLKIVFAFRVTPQCRSLQHHALAVTLSSPSNERLG